MKRFLLIALFVLIGSLAFAQERIAIFPFEDRNNVYTKDELDSFYAEFINEFRNKTDDSKFTVLTRQDMEKIINMEAKFQLSDYSSKEKTAEMFRVLNAKQVLYCLILKVGNEIRITLTRYTFPELTVLRGGKTISVTNKNQLFGRISELVQAMVNEIAGGSTSAQMPIPANFVRVEGGTFQMGDPNDYDNRDRPVHTVTVRSFSISKYEVTQKEWYEIMGTTVRQQRDMVDKSYTMNGEGDNYPMYYVNWYEAVEYCNRRSVKEGLTSAYRGSGNSITCDWNANGYRLPTDAEWEFAAKGGTKEYLTTEYSGSNSVGAVAWYDGNSGGSMYPVGTKAPNSLGIYDMSGNISEWCWDWYGGYSSGSQTDPRGPVSGTLRVGRGGSWINSAAAVRSAKRGDFYPSFRNSTMGFRLVRSLNN
jgi:formylglycine-generating enzyme required for sulfatase activity